MRTPPLRASRLPPLPNCRTPARLAHAGPGTRGAVEDITAALHRPRAAVNSARGRANGFTAAAPSLPMSARVGVSPNGTEHKTQKTRTPLPSGHAFVHAVAKHLAYLEVWRKEWRWGGGLFKRRRRRRRRRGARWSGGGRRRGLPPARRPAGAAGADGGRR